MTHKTSTKAKSLTAQQRELVATQMRIDGATYDTIGKHLGVSAEAARKAVLRTHERRRAELVEAIDELRERDEMRLDALWMRVEAVLEADPENLGAINAALNVLARRAKLLGLDGPAKHTVEVHGTGAIVFGRAMQTPDGRAALEQLAEASAAAMLEAGATHTDD